MASLYARVSRRGKMLLGLEAEEPGRVIRLDYPVDPTPRYQLGVSPHPELWRWFDERRAACEQAIARVAAFRDELGTIPRATDDPAMPHWGNIWFSLLDGMVLYTLVADRQPRRLIEVGSGNSTKFAALAVRRHKLPTQVTSIDPQPRVPVDQLCADVVRQPLERVGTELFRDLRGGDVLFIDNSHRAFTNSDVTTFFLEILPRLSPGVIVHIHDIFLPWDYPVEWSKRYYSEQYLLACWLLANPDRFQLIASNAFISFDAPLRDLVTRAAAGSALEPILEPGGKYGGVRDLLGTSVWLEIR